MKQQMVTTSKTRLGLYQTLVFRILKNIKIGTIIINDGESIHRFSGQQTDLMKIVHIKVLDSRAYRRLLFSGSVGAGKSYMLGEWTTDNLPLLIELILANAKVFAKIDGFIYRIANVFTLVYSYFRGRGLPAAKQDILAHYDVGNDFFAAFLDTTMMYSCAIYDNETQNQLDASLKKLETVCSALKLTSADHVLEIGSGWGGFAFYAVENYDCRVTTTTISDKQYAYVSEQIKLRGLENKITLLNKDYRLLQGQFDKIVSIEMIEAIGYKNMDNYFQKCSDLLKPGGLLFIQAITINDNAYQKAKYDSDFIKKYIFPGGCLPSLGSISRAISKQSEMRLSYINDIGKHYVTTLQDWLAKFQSNTEYFIKLGYDSRFIRMWEFYFCYCMAGFNSAHISNIHALWQKKLEANE